MSKRQLTAACVCLMAVAPGCQLLIDLLTPRITAVRLVNNGDFDVKVTLYTDDDQNIPRDVLVQTGTRREYTIAPGQTASFSDGCDDLQAVVIDNAELMVIGQVGPEADTDVLRDGDDFDCGDTITFTFDHSGSLVDFAISTSVQKG